MSEKHTPGPWVITASDGRYGDHRVSSRDGMVAVVGNGHNIGSALHDAHLIAAAPDLLAVARYAEAILADVLEGKVDPVTALDAISDLAKPAIAKATPTPVTSA